LARAKRAEMNGEREKEAEWPKAKRAKVNGAEATEEPRRLRPDHEKGHYNDRQRGYRAPMEGRARIAQMPCTTALPGPQWSTCDTQGRHPGCSDSHWVTDRPRETPP
jgi:hypothetical protein